MVQEPHASDNKKMRMCPTNSKLNFRLKARNLHQYLSHWQKDGCPKIVELCRTDRTSRIQESIKDRMCLQAKPIQFRVQV